MKFFNTRSKKKETFRPLTQGIVKIYSCGPTVYGPAHLGNLRAYIFADVLNRFLNFKGYQTRWVMNITDIDDKTIQGAKKAGVSLKEFTKKNENNFLKDLKYLNVKKADFYPKATENIKEIQDLIKRLFEKGYAYEKNDSVYFDISRFKNYGKLSHLDLEGVEAGARVDADQYEKEAPGDFVLWKKKKPGEPAWQLNVNGLKLDGRPGWHIECSAMAMKYLGATLDFHLGGVDLIFPHHENEIAQSEAATGKPFVRFWLHNEHLLIDGKKMAKSLGNFYILKDLIARGFDPLSFRYLCLQTHYRSKMNFTWESLEAAEKTLKEIKKLGQRESGQSISASVRRFIISAFEDDLDTPKALAILHRANNFNLWLEFDKVLGLGLGKIKEQRVKIKNEIRSLLEKREELRKQGRFEEADKIREKIQKMGYEIEDTEEGPRLIKS